MDHGLMTGMLVAGIVLSVIPLTVGVWLGVVALRLWRAARVGVGPEGGGSARSE